MNYQDFINQGYIYIYRGDRYTDVQYKMQPCLPVLTSTGKCIRGKNGNMLVSFQSGTVVVLARQLRRLDKLVQKKQGNKGKKSSGTEYHLINKAKLKKVISNQLVLPF
jgi:hypothetical protein